MRDNRPKFHISIKIIFLFGFLLIIISCLLLYVYNKAPEKPPASISLEGKNTYWSVFTTIPYTEETDDKYVKITFTCCSVDHIFGERDVVSFAIGTFAGGVVYSYKKPEGYIKSEYSNDPVERIVRVSDDTFEVLYNFKDLFGKDIFYLSRKDKDKYINVQIGNDDESINLLPVE